MMIEENKVDVSTGRTSNSPAEPAMAPKFRTADGINLLEKRSEYRTIVKWRADVFTEGHGTYHCMIKNISTNGGAIFGDHNFQRVKFLKLHIFMPPLNAKGKRHTLEVHGKVVCTSYDCHELLFRANVHFIKFSLESDLELLEKRLAHY